MIYIVMLVDMRKMDNSGTWVIENKYNVGYFLTLDDATKATKDNSHGMFDRYHCKYAVIKKCDEGIFGWKSIVKWFERGQEDSATGIHEISAPINL